MIDLSNMYSFEGIKNFPQFRLNLKILDLMLRFDRKGKESEKNAVICMHLLYGMNSEHLGGSEHLTHGG